MHIRATFTLALVLAATSPAALAAEDLGCAHCREGGAWAWRQPAKARPERPTIIDPATGRSLLNYPPHRHWDTEKLRLSITIPDMNVPRFDATASLTMQAIDDGLTHITLNAARLKITSVSVNDQSAIFTHDGEILTITLPDGISRTRGHEARVSIDYSVENPVDGMIWTPESPAWPGRAAQLHTQGQAESNRYWFPAHDSPNERMITELDVRVPKGFTASGNGRLVSRTEDGPYARYQFAMNADHPAYLVSLIVGKFEVVDLPWGDAKVAARVPMRVFVPPGKSVDALRTYARTAQMMEVFEHLTGLPYPWEKYDQLVVHNFAAGGMENTTVTSMHDTAVLDANAFLDGDMDGLIAHELAHQWFGDLITCNAWEHLWLNEGFATYLDALWHERRPGGTSTGTAPAGSEDWYLCNLAAGLRGVIKDDTANAPKQPGMVSKRYRNPWEVFRRAANPYPKGAMVLHMLRRRLGDDLFFKGIRTYVSERKFTTVETGDLRRSLERTTGESLEAFFDQWAVRPGVPKVTVRATWDAAQSRLAIALEQTQPINADNPAFALSVPVVVRDSAGQLTTVTVHLDTRTGQGGATLAARPVALALDPHMDMLADYTLITEADWNTATLQSPVTAIAAIRATRSIIEQADASADSLRAVTGALQGPIFWGAKSAMLHEIGNRRPSLLLDPSLADWRDTDARVRRAHVEAFGTWLSADNDAKKPTDTQRQAIVATLMSIRRTGEIDEPSYAVRGAIAKALGQSKDATTLPVILAYSQQPSQHDAIRRGAMEGLAALESLDGLPRALELAQPGNLPRTRTAAIDAIGAIGRLAPDQALPALTPLLREADDRVARAAAGAIVKVGDPRGADLLRAALASTTLTPSDRDRLEDQLAELLAPKPKDTEPKAASASRPDAPAR